MQGIGIGCGLGYWSPSMNRQTFYSHCEDEFHGDEPDDVLTRLYEDERLVVGAEYYSLAFEEKPAASYFNPYAVIEALTEDVYQDCDEGAERLDEDLKPHAEELVTLVTEWIGRHSEVSVWVPVGKTVVHKVTQEDMDRITKENEE